MSNESFGGVNPSKKLENMERQQQESFVDRNINPIEMTEKQAELSKLREKWTKYLANLGLSPDQCLLEVKEGATPETAELSGRVNGHTIEAFYSFDESGERIYEKFTYDGESVNNPYARKELTERFLRLVDPAKVKLQNEANKEILDFNTEMEKKKLIDMEEAEAGAIILQIEQIFFPSVLKDEVKEEERYQIELDQYYDEGMSYANQNHEPRKF